MVLNEFDEYKKLGEPDKLEKSKIWKTAIGLQDVDRLKPSEYLIETAKKNIEGDISFYEVKGCIEEYYKIQSPHKTLNRTEEADKVSARIAEILSEDTFSFSPVEYLLIHKRLFEGVLDNKIVGKAREYNIKKAEWVLCGQSVYYASAHSIMETLEYDLKQEKNFSYKDLSETQRISHIGKFISDLWQIHTFGEGNTRTTAVFIIKYLRTLGFIVHNDLFTKHSWYFRNALVRANYNDYSQNIYASPEFLNKFLENLLQGKKHILKNREMLISNTLNKTPQLKTKDKVLALIKETPTISAVKMAEVLGLSVETIRDQLKRLKSNDIINRLGANKTGKWGVKDEM